MAIYQDLQIYPTYDALGVLVAPDAMTGQRWTSQRERREMLDGTWRQQLIDAAKKTVGTTRIEGWAPPSLARNIAETVCRELAVLWDSPSSVSHEVEAAGALVTTTQTIAGLQQLMQRLQYYTVGIGSCYMRMRGFVRTKTNDDGEEDIAFPRVGYEVVTPDMVYDIARNDGTRQPVLVRQYKPRPVDGKLRWTADEWDMRDPTNPAYRLLYISGTRLEVVDEQSGDDYRYVRIDGRPVLPYVLYHDGPPRVGLHDPDHRTSLFSGALDIAVMYWMTGPRLSRRQLATALCRWPRASRRRHYRGPGAAPQCRGHGSCYRGNISEIRGLLRALLWSGNGTRVAT